MPLSRAKTRSASYSPPGEEATSFPWFEEEGVTVSLREVEDAIRVSLVINH